MLFHCGTAVESVEFHMTSFHENHARILFLSKCLVILEAMICSIISQRIHVCEIGR